MNLNGMNQERLNELGDLGITDIQDIPENFPMTGEHSAEETQILFPKPNFKPILSV